MVTYAAAPWNDSLDGPPSVVPSASTIDGKPVTIRWKLPPGRIFVTAPVRPKQRSRGGAGGGGCTGERMQGPEPPLPPSTTYSARFGAKAIPRGLLRPDAMVRPSPTSASSAAGENATAASRKPQAARLVNGLEFRTSIFSQVTVASCSRQCLTTTQRDLFRIIKLCAIHAQPEM